MVGPADGCRVVVADDMDDIRFLLRIQLEGSGHFEIVGEAADGEKAVEVVGRTRPDVVILDISMPVMDGLQAIPLIRKSSPETKIIVLTGFESEQTYRSAIDLGADTYLQKSVALADVSAAVWDVCQQQRAG